MKFKLFFRPVLAIAVLILAGSCARNDIDMAIPATDGDKVNVNFSYTVDELAAGDELTLLGGSRTIPTDIDHDDPGVFNMWVIQFNGISESSTMIGAPRFISESELLSNSFSVPLIKTAGLAYTVFVANMDGGETYTWNLSNESTYADVAKRVKMLTSESGTYKTLGSTPTKTLLLSGVTTVQIDGSGIAVALKRNVSKLTLNLSNVSGSGVTIQSVRLRNVSTQIAYAETALATLTSYNDNITVFDYDAVTTGLPGDGASATFTWFAPRNERGTSASANYKDKTAYAPNYATYFEVVATKGTNSSIFRVYPGTNDYNDYNILANHQYSVTLNITDIGTDASDSRVQTFSNTVEFAGLTGGRTSNSFIVNPAPTGGGLREFRVPLNQITRYWSGAAEGYGAANKVNASTTWAASILWTDFDNSSSIVAMQNYTGTGFADDKYFSFRVTEGAAAGNFVIVVKSGSEILWSWHFWITDYNPNVFVKNTIASGIYTYPVPGGQVERYADYSVGSGVSNIWTTTYANQVMMDRALGAVETYFTAPTSSSTPRGILYYQFGRKDPLPASTLYGSSITALAGTVTIASSLSTPTAFITVSSGNWTTEATSTSFEWNDPLTGSTGIKSIYDPCPPGWRIPANGTWNDFNRQTSGGELITTRNVQRDLGWSYGRNIGTAGANILGLRYWPGTTMTDPVAGRIWYPASGLRAPTTSAVTSMGTSGYYWSATAGNTAVGNLLRFAGSDPAVHPNYILNRSYGFSARCVSEGN